MHFQGIFMFRKRLLPGLRPGPGPPQDVNLCFSLLALVFWPLGASSPLVTPISG